MSGEIREINSNSKPKYDVEPISDEKNVINDVNLMNISFQGKNLKDSMQPTSHIEQKLVESFQNKNNNEIEKNNDMILPKQSNDTTSKEAIQSKNTNFKTLHLSKKVEDVTNSHLPSLIHNHPHTFLPPEKTITSLIKKPTGTLHHRPLSAHPHPSASPRLSPFQPHKTNAFPPISPRVEPPSPLHSFHQPFNTFRNSFSHPHNTSPLRTSSSSTFPNTSPLSMQSLPTHSQPNTLNLNGSNMYIKPDLYGHPDTYGNPNSNSYLPSHISMHNPNQSNTFQPTLNSSSTFTPTFTNTPSHYFNTATDKSASSLGAAGLGILGLGSGQTIGLGDVGATQTGFSNKPEKGSLYMNRTKGIDNRFHPSQHNDLSNANNPMHISNSNSKMHLPNTNSKTNNPTHVTTTYTTRHSSDSNSDKGKKEEIMLTKQLIGLMQDVVKKVDSGSLKKKRRGSKDDSDSDSDSGGEGGKKKQKGSGSKNSKQEKYEYPSKISDNIYIGAISDARNKQRLLTLNVEYIINLTPKQVPNFFPTEFIYLTFEVDDEAQILSVLPAVLTQLQTIRDSNSRVLMHCDTGTYKSPVFAICAMALLMKISLEEAYLLVRGKRREVSLPALVWVALGNWEVQALGSSTMGNVVLKKKKKTVDEKGKGFVTVTHLRSIVDGYEDEVCQLEDNVRDLKMEAIHIERERDSCEATRNEAWSEFITTVSVYLGELEGGLQKCVSDQKQIIFDITQFQVFSHENTSDIANGERLPRGRYVARDESLVEDGNLTDEGGDDLVGEKDGQGVGEEDGQGDGQGEGESEDENNQTGVGNISNTGNQTSFTKSISSHLRKYAQLGAQIQELSTSPTEHSSTPNKDLPVNVLPPGSDPHLPLHSLSREIPDQQSNSHQFDTDNSESITPYPGPHYLVNGIRTQGLAVHLLPWLQRPPSPPPLLIAPLDDDVPFAATHTLDDTLDHASIPAQFKVLNVQDDTFPTYVPPHSPTSNPIAHLHSDLSHNSLYSNTNTNTHSHSFAPQFVPTSTTLDLDNMNQHNEYDSLSMGSNMTSHSLIRSIRSYNSYASSTSSSMNILKTMFPQHSNKLAHVFSSVQSLAEKHDYINQQLLILGRHSLKLQFRIQYLVEVLEDAIWLMEGQGDSLLKKLLQSERRLSQCESELSTLLQLKIDYEAKIRDLYVIIEDNLTKGQQMMLEMEQKYTEEMSRQKETYDLQIEKLKEKIKIYFEKYLKQKEIINYLHNYARQIMKDTIHREAHLIRAMDNTFSHLNKGGGLNSYVVSENLDLEMDDRGIERMSPRDINWEDMKDREDLVALEWRNYDLSSDFDNPMEINIWKPIDDHILNNVKNYKVTPLNQESLENTSDSNQLLETNPKGSKSLTNHSLSVDLTSDEEVSSPKPSDAHRTYNYHQYDINSKYTHLYYSLTRQLHSALKTLREREMKETAHSTKLVDIIKSLLFRIWCYEHGTQHYAMAYTDTDTQNTPPHTLNNRGSLDSLVNNPLGDKLHEDAFTRPSYRGSGYRDSEQSSININLYHQHRYEVKVADMIGVIINDVNSGKIKEPTHRNSINNMKDSLRRKHAFARGSISRDSMSGELGFNVRGSESEGEGERPDDEEVIDMSLDAIIARYTEQQVESIDTSSITQYCQFNGSVDLYTDDGVYVEDYNQAGRENRNSLSFRDSRTQRDSLNHNNYKRSKLSHIIAGSDDKVNVNELVTLPPPPQPLYTPSLLSNSLPSISEIVSVLNSSGQSQNLTGSEGDIIVRVTNLSQTTTSPSPPTSSPPSSTLTSLPHLPEGQRKASSNALLNRMLTKSNVQLEKMKTKETKTKQITSSLLNSILYDNNLFSLNWNEGDETNDVDRDKDRHGTSQNPNTIFRPHSEHDYRTKYENLYQSFLTLQHHYYHQYQAYQHQHQQHVSNTKEWGKALVKSQLEIKRLVDCDYQSQLSALEKLLKLKNSEVDHLNDVISGLNTNINDLTSKNIQLQETYEGEIVRIEKNRDDKFNEYDHEILQLNVQIKDLMSGSYNYIEQYQRRIEDLKKTMTIKEQEHHETVEGWRKENNELSDQVRELKTEVGLLEEEHRETVDEYEDMIQHKDDTIQEVKNKFKEKIDELQTYYTDQIDIRQNQMNKLVKDHHQEVSDVGDIVRFLQNRLLTETAKRKSLLHKDRNDTWTRNVLQSHTADLINAHNLRETRLITLLEESKTSIGKDIKAGRSGRLGNRPDD